MKLKMKKIERQNREFQAMVNNTSKEGVEYIGFVKDVYKRYKEELESRSIFTKIVVFIFGDFNTLGENLVDDYGKHNLDTLL